MQRHPRGRNPSRSGNANEQLNKVQRVPKKLISIGRSVYSAINATRRVSSLENVQSGRRYIFALSQNCVCSLVLVAKAFHDWIVDSGATKHVTWNREGFIGHHQTLFRHARILRNSTREDLIGVRSYNSSNGHEVLWSLISKLYVRCSA